MNKLFYSFFNKSAKQTSPRIVLLSTLLSTVSCGMFFFSGGKAYAQNFSIKSSEVRSYAKAVLEMEPVRQEAYRKLKTVIGNVPNIVCNKPESLNNLPRNAKNIAIGYCKRSRKIVTDHDLSPERFNQITAAVLKDESLKQRIYNQLVGIQNNRRRR